MRRLFLALTTLTMLGCSTQAVPPSQALYVPNDRVFKYQDGTFGEAKLTVIRDTGAPGRGCFATVLVNGEKVAKLNPKEKVVLNLLPGEVIIGAVIEGRGLCGWTGERQERSFVLSKGDTKFVRIFTDDMGNMDIMPTTLK